MLHPNKQSKQDGIKANFKYKFLSALQNNSQKGTTLVVGVALGTLMVGGTGLAIATANQNKTNVIAQEQTAQAIAAAETGITRIQAMLAKNPELALVNWSEFVEADDQNAQQIIKDTLDNALNPQSGAGDDGNNNACDPFAEESEHSLESEDAEKKLKKKRTSLKEVAGVVTRTNNDDDNSWVNIDNYIQYQLISYTPPENPNPNDDNLATLTIRGRRASGSNTSQAQLEVEFPIKITPVSKEINPSEGVGSLWVTDYDSYTNRNNFRSHEFRGDIKISVDNPDCKIKGDVPSNIVDGKAYPTSTKMPPTPELPVNATHLSNPWQTLPLTVDVTNKGNYADGFFHYIVDELEGTGNNANIKIKEGHKVALYVRGNIRFGGSAEINHNQNPSNLQIFGNTIQIDPDTGDTSYKYGCPSGKTSNCVTNTVRFNGTPFASFFIHAPEADAYLQGGGQSKSTGTPNSQGALWVKTWGATDGSGNKHPAFGQWNGLSYGDLLSVSGNTTSDSNSNSSSSPIRIESIQTFRRVGVE